VYFASVISYIQTRVFLASLVILTIPICQNAAAMSFVSEAKDNLTFITGGGVIRSGDAERLITEIIAAPRGAKFLLSMNSIGGSIIASEGLAAVVNRFKLPVIVSIGNVCASGCFLVFAASPLKMFFPSSQIGVHSASLNAQETMGTMGLTTIMARSASDLGVPPAILGRMVTTAPGSMAWLSPGELASMGGQLLGEPTTVSQPTPTTPSTPLATMQATPSAEPSNKPAPSSPKPPISNVPPDEKSPSFQEGRASRLAWEEWFATLAGDARSGAEFWTSERSKRRPGRCIGTADFQQACFIAGKKLAGTDIRQKADAQYWWGWNSL